MIKRYCASFVQRQAVILILWENASLPSSFLCPLDRVNSALLLRFSSPFFSHSILLILLKYKKKAAQSQENTSLHFVFFLSKQHSFPSSIFLDLLLQLLTSNLWSMHSNIHLFYSDWDGFPPHLFCGFSETINFRKGHVGNQCTFNYCNKLGSFNKYSNC